MKKVISYLIFPLLIVFILFLYGFSVSRNNGKVIEKIEVEFREGDNYFLTHEMVNNLLIQNGNSVVNQLKSSLNLYELEQQVLQNPFVENATVYVTPKGLLKTYIKQREPLVRLVDSNGSYYIDKFGTVMPMSSNYSARVPLVFNVSKPEDIEKVKKLMLFVQKDDFLNKEIVGLQRQGRDFLLEVRSGDYKVNIGDIVNLDIKFKKLKAFYNKALLDKTIEKYKVINIKYHNQVVCEK